MRTVRLLERARTMFLVRVLLVAGVMAGLVAMHVLSHPDGGAGHGSMSHPSSSGHGAPHDPMMTAEPTQVDAPVAADPAPAEHGMSMAECILFLAVGLTLLVALLLALLAGPRWPRLQRTLPARLGRRRGPPPTRPPRLIFCVLRV